MDDGDKTKMKAMIADAASAGDEEVGQLANVTISQLANEGAFANWLIR